MIRIIEIVKLKNGAHQNQTSTFNTIPDGWAVVPDDIETENFPFGDVEVKEIDGVMTVTKWTALPVPEKPIEPVSEIEQLRADVDYIAVMTGVEL